MRRSAATADDYLAKIPPATLSLKARRPPV